MAGIVEAPVVARHVESNLTGKARQRTVGDDPSVNAPTNVSVVVGIAKTAERIAKPESTAAGVLAGSDVKSTDVRGFAAYKAFMEEAMPTEADIKKMVESFETPIISPATADAIHGANEAVDRLIDAFDAKEASTAKADDEKKKKAPAAAALTKPAPKHTYHGETGGDIIRQIVNHNGPDHDTVEEEVSITEALGYATDAALNRLLRAMGAPAVLLGLATAVVSPDRTARTQADVMLSMDAGRLPEHHFPLFSELMHQWEEVPAGDAYEIERVGHAILQFVSQWFQTGDPTQFAAVWQGVLRIMRRPDKPSHDRMWSWVKRFVALDAAGFSSERSGVFNDFVEASADGNAEVRMIAAECPLLFYAARKCPSLGFLCSEAMTPPPEAKKKTKKKTLVDAKGSPIKVVPDDDDLTDCFRAIRQNCNLTAEIMESRADGTSPVVLTQGQAEALHKLRPRIWRQMSYPIFVTCTTGEHGRFIEGLIHTKEEARFYYRMLAMFLTEEAEGTHPNRAGLKETTHHEVVTAIMSYLSLSSVLATSGDELVACEPLHVGRSKPKVTVTKFIEHTTERIYAGFAKHAHRTKELMAASV